jgi:cytochrome c oxidase subunit 2
MRRKAGDQGAVDSGRRRVVKGAVAAAGAIALPAFVARAQSEPRVIEMVAKRFVYEPNEIALKAGEPVVIAIKSIDFVHGMNIPGLKIRLDLVPGKITKLNLHPKEPGTIEFVCDNFCGDRHEEMHGKFVVT